MIAKHIDRFPLLKLDQVIDWQPIEQYLNRQRTRIQTAGGKQRQAIEVDDEGQVSGQTTPSKDKDARWTKKNGLYRLGYETTYPHRF